MEQETPKTEKKEKATVYDIETYCDIKGIHDADRFVLLRWFSAEKPKSIVDWDKESEKLWAE